MVVPAIHHLELWTQHLADTAPSFDWLLSQLGWQRDDVDGWPQGRIWRCASGEYLVLEQSPHVSGPHNRHHAGLNHLALSAPSRAKLDQLRADAPAHGWSELFADAYPHAGGPTSVALYLANTEGFEVELVASIQ